MRNRGEGFLGAGETVGKQRIAVRWPVGKIELADEMRALLACELEQFVAHHATPD
jgi:hypothetical protein